MRTSLILALVLTGCLSPSTDFVADLPASRPTTDRSQDFSPAELRRRAFANFNLDSEGLAIHGYDPVAYFPEGGGEPTLGKKQFSYSHDGVTYRFASQEHLDLFRENQEKYEPLYGGWCAWAMVTGDKVDIDADSYIVTDEGLFLFYDSFFADTRRKWLKRGHDKLKPPADAWWRDVITR